MQCSCGAVMLDREIVRKGRVVCWWQQCKACGRVLIKNFIRPTASVMVKEQSP